MEHVEVYMNRNGKIHVRSNDSYYVSRTLGEVVAELRDEGRIDLLQSLKRREFILYLDDERQDPKTMAFSIQHNVAVD